MDFEQKRNVLLSKDSYNVYDLTEIVSLLRSENGCPWDKVQTHETIRKDMLEETYEVLEAIDCASPEMLREELGDVLLQVVFHADIEKDAGRFELDDIADEVCKKLILRHPHVFGDVQADTAETVLKNWDAIKKDEKKQETYTDTLTSVPKVFPSLMRAQKLTKRAERAGLEFTAEELDEQLVQTAEDLKNADSEQACAKLLMTAAQIVRAHGYDAEELLAKECNAFTEKFSALEKSADEKYGSMSEADKKEIKQIWLDI